MRAVEELKSSLNAYNANLAEERNRIADYQVKIDAIYNNMKEWIC